MFNFLENRIGIFFYLASMRANDYDILSQVILLFRLICYSLGSVMGKTNSSLVSSLSDDVKHLMETPRNRLSLASNTCEPSGQP